MADSKNVFSPTIPIFDKKFFFGRREELGRLKKIVDEPGQHGFLFGERGAGKTSLINVFMESYKSSPTTTLKISCHRSNNEFNSLVTEVLNNLVLNFDLPEIFNDKKIENYIQKILRLEMISSNSIINLFKKLKKKLIIVIDEMDLFSKKKLHLQLLADFVKGISDNCSALTIIFSGIANSMNSILSQHESLFRCLSEIHLGRMNNEEINDIIDNGLTFLQLTIAPEVKKKIVNYSKGFPYFTHMLAKYASENAKDLNYNAVLVNNLHHAVERTITNSNQSLKKLFQNLTEKNKNRNYEKITYSAVLYEEHYQEDIDENQLFKSNVLLFFTAKDIWQITKHYYPEIKITNVHYCLNKLAEENKQQVFIKEKTNLSVQYAFKNPLFQTFLLLNYFNEGKEKLKVYL